MKYKNNLLIIIFGIILVLPNISLLFGFGNNVYLNDNRPLASIPKIGIYKEFPVLFSNYFNDHLGLRNLSIVTSRWIRFNVFNVSPNKSVTVGKNDWLFFTSDIHYIDSINAQPFKQNDLEQIKNNFLNIQNKFKDKGIKFYFLVAPNKQSIYPEYLPDYMKKINPDSRLDQLTSYLAEFKEINFINPKKELGGIKKISPVYLKYDTHWNNMGAFVAYQKLGKKINQDFPIVKTKSLDDYNLVEKEAINRDLLEVQMGITEGFKETEKVFENINIKSKIVEGDCPDVYKTCGTLIKEINNPKLPKLVMFRDSFGNKLIPFISEHFRRSYYYWGSIPFSYSIIEKEKPDMVIMELTERELWRIKDELFVF